MIVTIDGPAGSGKSSAARGLAKRLGFRLLDTGAMYRAVALACVRQNVDLADESAVTTVARQCQIVAEDGRVLLDGEDVSQTIREPAVSEAASQVASQPEVRQHLVRMQRELGKERNLVTEGRDQGTVVFPDAECKFYVDAHPDERAQRRYQEMLAQGQTISVEETLQQIRERDARDASRVVSPMKKADDAIEVDTSTMPLEAVLDLMERVVRERLNSPAPKSQ
ncbi:MAG: (d)CMP kinase [Planctomycetota bacterium]|nr:(d)CMP kinase [Planctomycetota bacterium]MDA1212176.1 (d)CMP kinase [Planctomycetota bacterium]